MDREYVRKLRVNTLFIDWQIAKTQVLYRCRPRGCCCDRDERDPERASICDTHIPLFPSPSLLPPHLKSGLFLISPVPPLNPAQSRTNLRERGRAHHLMPPGFWEERQAVRQREEERFSEPQYCTELPPENQSLGITRKPNACLILPICQ